MNLRTRTWLIRVVFMSTDMCIWLAAIVVAAWLRYEFEVSSLSWAGLILFGVVAAGLQALIGFVMGVYRGRHPYGTFEEVKTIVYLVVLVGLNRTGILGDSIVWKG